MIQSPFARKKRSKTKAAREIAADYLSSICLNGNVDTYLNQLESSSENVKTTATFTTSDEFKFLVKLTSIAHGKRDQTNDYFNYYRERVKKLNKDRCNEDESFAKSEFERAAKINMINNWSSLSEDKEQNGTEQSVESSEKNCNDYLAKKSEHQKPSNRIIKQTESFSRKTNCENSLPGSSYTKKKSAQALLRKLSNERIMFASNNSYVGLFTRIPFTGNNRSAKPDLNDSFQFNSRQRHQSVKSNSVQENFLIDVFDMLDIVYTERRGDLMSFESFIDCSSSKCLLNSYDDGLKNGANEAIVEESSDFTKENDDTEMKALMNAYNSTTRKESNIGMKYEPNYLDDPQLTEMTAGKNRTCLKFSSYSVSLIDYVKPLDLKKEINETFREKFPLIQLTLTKLRSLKNELSIICNDCSMDPVIVAQSFIYFEKIILNGLMNKANRKYIAGSCLVLAAKLNDLNKQELNKLIEKIVQKFRLDNRKDLMAFEFPIMLALKFNLMINYETELNHHYDRIIGSQNLAKENMLKRASMSYRIRNGD